MGVREKAKNLFKSKSRTSSQPSTNSGSPDRWPSNVYRPDEPMPRPKYRAPPKKEHKEKLEAFNFADAWRKKSFQSTYSPMGTRAPSRVPSAAPSRRTSFLSFGKTSRSTSVSSEMGAGQQAGARQREGHGAALATRLSTEVEQEGDDDVGNVGLSRVQTREREKERPRTAEDVRAQEQMEGLEKMDTVTARDHLPFSERDLALAMSRTRLEVAAQS
ncbi:uncharacterized protein LTR77_008215 [Saxophila tyrrhenica]|uniref:Uncharacterized protein n=1 Tax=Saxophila tyrrhenica TaxID=1690608 RepID=A0AAV9P5Z5_9PEZI|nr:hypothetical protein LTR77_008215 [Saxophila tyrrhenica]